MNKLNKEMVEDQILPFGRAKKSYILKFIQQSVGIFTLKFGEDVLEQVD